MSEIYKKVYCGSDSTLFHVYLMALFLQKDFQLERFTACQSNASGIGLACTNIQFEAVPGDCCMPVFIDTLQRTGRYR
jgi:hypothetical protein